MPCGAPMGHPTAVFRLKIIQQRFSSVFRLHMSALDQPKQRISGVHVDRGEGFQECQMLFKESV